MGALAESLRMIRLSGALFLDAEMPSQWCYLSPTPQSLREELVPGKAVLAFHVVAHGSCIASLPGREPIEVGPGELLLFPRGEQHILASSMRRAEVGSECASSERSRTHPIDLWLRRLWERERRGCLYRSAGAASGERG
jgi:hypothetical protein